MVIETSRIVTQPEMIGEKTSRGYNMVLISGRPFFPLSPEPDEIIIEDIAHSLALQCRFNGHTKEFYSVAQHCVIVSQISPRGFEMEGLLHDAAEAYIGDLIRPVKASCPDWKAIDAQLDAVIRRKFGLPPSMSPEVALADNILAATERRDLIEFSPMVDWGKMPDPLPDTIIPVDWRTARELFLSRYEEVLNV